MSIGNQKKAEISHYLGIDYGKSDVGLALADVETKIAFAYKKLKNDSDLMNNLMREMKQKSVIMAVVGLPQYDNISKDKDEYRQFGEKLEKYGKVDVEYYSEMFTTKMAQANLIDKGIRGVKQYDDQEAARIILQEWIDNRESR